MSFARYMAALLIGFLVSWGGLGGFGTHMAMAGQPAAMSFDAPTAVPAHSRTHMNHDQDGQVPAAGHDGHGAGKTAPACCLFACGLVTVLPAPDLQFSDVGWEVLHLQALADDTLSGRSVSPLRRPPRQFA